jgi:protoheme IX farnesyltransferase
MSAVFRDYIELCKPRVVMLMILTSVVGMCLATTTAVPLSILVFGNLGIALVASAAAALNHVADQHIDKLMGRTQYRPIVQGKISSRQSILFSAVLCVTGILILFWLVNPLTAGLTFLSSVGYAVLYAVSKTRDPAKYCHWRSCRCSAAIVRLDGSDRFY